MSVRKVWSIAAWVITIAAAALGCVLPFLRWAPQFDFDILGFAWLLTNFPNLTAWAAFLVLAALSVYCWARTLTADPNPF
jgi:hypothetical protein